MHIYIYVCQLEEKLYGVGDNNNVWRPEATATSTIATPLIQIYVIGVYYKLVILNLFTVFQLFSDY